MVVCHLTGHINPGCTGCYTRDQRQPNPLWCHTSLLLVFCNFPMIGNLPPHSHSFKSRSYWFRHCLPAEDSCLCASESKHWCLWWRKPRCRQRSGAVLKRFYFSLVLCPQSNQMETHLKQLRGAGWWESPWGPASFRDSMEWCHRHGAQNSGKCTCLGCKQAGGFTPVEAHWKIPPSVLQRQEWEHPGVGHCFSENLVSRGLFMANQPFLPKIWEVADFFPRLPLCYM